MDQYENIKQQKLPLEIGFIIQNFARPVTRCNWRQGSPSSFLIKKEIIRVGYHHFKWTDLTLASFLISHDLMKKSIIENNSNIYDTFLNSIINHVEQQFLENGYYL